jgi:hypothetical protein
MNKQVLRGISSKLKKASKAHASQADKIDGMLKMRSAPLKAFAKSPMEKKKGLWHNIHAKRKKGESPAKPGDKDYPKTLNV